jgi:hypothetical protein
VAPRQQSVAPPFSLTQGGPAYRLWVLLAHGSWRRLAIVVIAITWVPIMLLSLVEWRSTGKWPALVVSYSFHVKALLAVPVLLAAETMLNRRTRRCVDRIYDAGVVDPAAFAPLVAVAIRRRDSRLVEVALVALALLGSQLVVWGALSPVGIVRGRGLGPGSAAAIWNGVVALGVYQFLIVRWLWRWLIWSRLLWGLSRLPLQTLPTHPDRRGGLAFLAQVSSGFAAVIFAISAVQSSVWADQVAFDHASVMSFKNEAALLAVLGLLLALGPLIPFARPLWEARLEALHQYGLLAVQHGRLFHDRWIRKEAPEGLLGAPDISSLADLGTCYEVIAEMRPLPFTLHTVIIVALAVLLPLVPLALMQVPLVELIKKLSGTALGGMAR